MSMKRYVVTKSFSVGGTGGNNGNDLSLQLGQEIGYDGKGTIEVDGEVYRTSRFRGALSQGWVVEGDQFDAGNYGSNVPVRAPMKIRSAEGGNPMDYRQEDRRDIRHTAVENEDREVRKVASHAQATRDWNNGRGQTRGSAMPISVEEQGGTVVHEGFQTAPKTFNNIEHGIGPALSRAAAVKIKPGQGISREEMMARMPEQDREQYLAEIDALRSAYVEEPRVVNRVATKKKQHTEGFDIELTVGGGTETVDLGGQGGPGTVTTEIIEGFKVTNLNGPKRANRVDPPAKATPARLVPTQKAVMSGIDVRRKVAKAMCPDFPDMYDFEAPEKKKLARITADFEDRPDVIQAIYAAEGDSMKSLLVENFPEAF